MVEIDKWNHDPGPFVWQKSADEILDTLGDSARGSVAQDTSSDHSRRRMS